MMYVYEQGPGKRRATTVLIWKQQMHNSETRQPSGLLRRDNAIRKNVSLAQVARTEPGDTRVLWG